MEPIEKNVSVIDEYGNEYEATYPKRAKGLVKKGRARFVDDNTICLACPPNILEDTKMSDNNIKTKVNETAEPIEAAEKIEGIEKIDEMSGLDEAADLPPKDTENDQLETAVTEYLRAHNDKSPKNTDGAEKVLELYQKISVSGLPYSDKEPLLKKLLSEWKKIVEDISETAALEKEQPELSIGYILSQIEKIRQEDEYIYKALETLSGIVSGQGPADVAGEGKANGIAATVTCRETTNQKLIAFYEKLYDDIKSEPVDFNHFSLEQIINAIERCDAGVMSDETSKALKSALLEHLKA